MRTLHFAAVVSIFSLYGRPMQYRASHYIYLLLKCIRADWPLTMQVEQIKSILC